MLSVSPPWVPCKAPCVGGMFLLEGKLVISWCFLLFESFVSIIQVSRGRQLLTSKPWQCWGISLLLAPCCALAGHGGGGVPLPTFSAPGLALLGHHGGAMGREEAGSSHCCGAVFENKYIFFLRLL